MGADLLRGSYASQRVASLFLQGSESCVDGRAHDAVISTPGGNAGELVVVLSALQALRGDSLQTDEVRSGFDVHVAHFGRFYLHTDRYALEALQRDLYPQLALAEVEQRLRHPTSQDERARLLTHLTMPTYVGCGHLKAMLNDADAYGVDPRLVVEMLKVVYAELWHHPENVEFVVLTGEHHEEAVVQVHTPSAVRAPTNVTALLPIVNGRSYFVIHPEITAFLRGEFLAALYDELPWVRAVAARTAVEKQANELGGHYGAVTLQKLAPKLPVLDFVSTSGRLVPK